MTKAFNPVATLNEFIDALLIGPMESIIAIKNSKVEKVVTERKSRSARGYVSDYDLRICVRDARGKYYSLRRV